MCKMEVKKSMLAINNNCASSLLSSRPVTTTSRFMAWLGAASRRREREREHNQATFVVTAGTCPDKEAAPAPPSHQHLMSFNWTEV